MKVLMVADFYPPLLGGMEQAVQDLSRELGSRGVQVAVATLRQEGLPLEERDGPVHVHRLQGAAQRLPFLFAQPDRRYHPPLPDPALVRQLGRLIERERPDVVHGHSWMMLSALPLKRSLGFATTYTLHDRSLLCPKKTLLYAEERPCPYHLSRHCPGCASQTYGPVKGPLVTAGLALGRRLYREVDVFMALSRYVRDIHLQNSLTAHARIVLVPQILSTDLLHAPPRPRLPDLPDDYILFAGVLSRHKGLHVLLEAYRLLEPDVPLVAIGPSWKDTPKRVPPGVLLHPGLSHADLIRAVDHCRFVVSPSVVPEVSSRVVLEAMARGKAILASRAGGTPEAVRHGETGLLVEPGDVVSLRSALEALLADPALAQRIGRAGAVRCREGFDPAEVTARTLDVYRTALDRQTGVRSRAG